MAQKDFNREIIEKTLYESIWKSRIEWQKDIIQYILVVVGVFTVMKYGIEHQHLFVATILSQLAILWIIAVIIAASYSYRQHQLISSRLEIINELNKSPCVLPWSFNSIKNPKPFSLPEIYKIHFAFFSVLLLVVSGYYVKYSLSKLSGFTVASIVYAIWAVLFVSIVLLIIIQKKCLNCCNSQKVFFIVLLMVFAIIISPDRFIVLNLLNIIFENKKIFVVVVVFSAGLSALSFYWVDRNNSIEENRKEYRKTKSRQN